MKKRIRNYLSILIISAMTLAGFGSAVFATGGTGDATLASLEVSPGTLSPEFSSDCYEYSVEVGEDCDKLLVNAQTTDGGAKAVIAGNSGLKAGVNSVIIKVTAADGVTSARYTIQVTRGTAEEGESSGAQGSQTAPGSQLGGGIASSPLISGNLSASESQETESPEEAGADGEEPGTEASAVGEDNLGDGQVPGSGELPDGEVAGGEDPGTAGQAAGTIVTAGKTYTLAVPDEAIVPSGFEAATASVGGQTVPVWQFPSNYEVTGLYLIYGTSPEGKTAFYIYDESEGTVITAGEGLLSIGQEGKISQNQLRSAQEVYQKSLKSRMMIIICLSVGCFILLIALTAALTRKRRQEEEPYQAADRKTSYERESEPEDDEEDFYEEEFYDDDDLDDDFYEEEAADGFYDHDDEEYEEVYGEEGADDLSDTADRDTANGEIEHQKEEAEPSEAVEGEQKKKRLTEAESEAGEPEWDTAPLPNFEDTGKLELVREAVAEVLEEEDRTTAWEEPIAAGKEMAVKEEAATAEAEDFDLEDIDLELFDLEEDEAVDLGEGSEGVCAEEPEVLDLAEPEDAAPETLDLIESEETAPEAGDFEEPEDVGPVELDEDERSPEVFELEKQEESEAEDDETAEQSETDAEESGFEEITLEEEEEWFPLPEEEEDVDAEFDLLDALLSDSLRDGKPVGRK